jgi:hypothetical protein
MFACFLEKPCSVRRRNRSSRGVCGFSVVAVQTVSIWYIQYSYSCTPVPYFSTPDAGTLRAFQHLDVAAQETKII